jgi:hypothetical protein
MPGYAPVEWIIDKTPLDGPLFWWCDLFGVRHDAETAQVFREYEEMLRGIH